MSEVPAAVVAKATGYSAGTTAARAARTGSDWAPYAALKRVGTNGPNSPAFEASSQAVANMRLIEYASLLVRSESPKRTRLLEWRPLPVVAVPL